MSGKVLVVGSSNTDMVVKTSKFPRPGETVLGGIFLSNPGGKGANQAVAASRTGANVRFVTKVGNDIFGKQALDGFIQEGLDIANILQTSEFASGVALITVNENGENQIVVASGANMDLKPADLPDSIFQDIEYVLVQLEIQLETVLYLVEKCSELKINVILNPAPAVSLNDDLLKNIYLITPNETETHILTGILPDSPEAMKKAGRLLLDKGIKNVIITLGEKGVFLMNNEVIQTLPAIVVTPVDTTAAGDVFNGALLTALSEDKNLPEACEFACKAAAIAVTRMGAQSSAPYRKEIL